jgi:hypothetical protein
MSIVDESSESVIKLGTLHGWIFKISLWAAPIFSLWAVSSIVRHDKDIAVLKMQIVMIQTGGKGGVSQNVNVGKTEPTTELVDTARDYVTTADIAAREKVTERAVLDWISAGRIYPTPVKAGKSWAIAKNFRILPNDAECCGEPPNQETDNRP